MDCLTLSNSDCVSFNYVYSRFSWLHSQVVQRCGSGFEERIFDSRSSYWNRDFLDLSIFPHMRLIMVG